MSPQDFLDVTNFWFNPNTVLDFIIFFFLLFTDWPLVATDEIMKNLENGNLKKLIYSNSKDISLTEKIISKAIRRRNFIDMCREAIFYQVL